MNLTYRSLYPIVFCIVLCILAEPIFAQAQPEDLHKYFDDNGLSTRKNIISTNLLAPVSGLIGLRYERALSKRLSIEIGVQKVMPFYLYELILPITSLVNYFDPEGGWSLSFSPHFYFWDKAPEFHYMGPRYGWRNYNMANGTQLKVHDFTIDYGYNLFLSKHFMFCYGIGGGIRHLRAYSRSTQPSAPRLVTDRLTFMAVNWSVGFGLMF